TWHPHFKFSILVVRGAVLRLERSVCDEGIGVRRFDNFCTAQRAVGFAVFAQGAASRLLRKLVSAASKAFAALLRSLAFIPGDAKFLAGSPSGPPTVGDDGDSAEQARQIGTTFHNESVPNAGNCLDFVDIGTDNFTREDRALLENGPAHSGNGEIDSEQGLAAEDRR